MTPPSTSPLSPRPETPTRLAGRLDQVVGRIRLLALLSGLGRLVGLAALILIGTYAVDRALDLPLGVRAALSLLLLGLMAREAWLRLLAPLLRGPGRLEAARLVETGLPQLEGRVITAWQLGASNDGSLQQAVFDQAEAEAGRLDLRTVLDPRPSWRQAARGGGLAVLLLVLSFALDPHAGVFADRWTFGDVPWPRRTHLQLQVADRGPAHVRQADGSLVAARGGVLDVEAAFEGEDPERVELVVLGADGTRTTGMGADARGTYRGHVNLREGDRLVSVRGGDDAGEDDAARVSLLVIEPPRLRDPEFVLEPPAYLAEAPRTVGPEGLVVTEGTAITLRGVADGEVESAELWLTSRGERIDLEVDTSTSPARVSGRFLADSSETLFVKLLGEQGLSAPEPIHYALLVTPDRAPTVRMFSPGRSDVKVTAQAVVPFAVIADDDHGVEVVTLVTAAGASATFTPDARLPGHQRLLIDLSADDTRSPGSYRVEAVDGRQLGDLGPQRAVIEGRRVDVVDDAEVQRLLADRQLRLKEAFLAIRDRQQRALETTDALLEDPPVADDPDLVAVVVSQHQVGTRLERETRELCTIMEETILNRLDPGPGAAALLERRLLDWMLRPVDDTFGAEAWTALASDYEAGAFGRLDLVGRLLDMSAIALRLVAEDGPAAHELLSQARRDPSEANLTGARAAQARVAASLDRLLERMDEWEDYQEVLALVKALIDDQAALRQRTQQVLSQRRSN